jgi:hypothetical protein
VGGAEDDRNSGGRALLGTVVGKDDNEMVGTVEGGTVPGPVLYCGETVLLDRRVGDT